MVGTAVGKKGVQRGCFVLGFKSSGGRRRNMHMKTGNAEHYMMITEAWGRVEGKLQILLYMGKQRCRFCVDVVFRGGL